MSIRTYRFHETGTIPGIPGSFHAGLVVDVDEDTMTVMATRLIDAMKLPDSVVEVAGKSAAEESLREDHQKNQPLLPQHSEDILE